MLVLQVIDIRWTKATRGAPRSRERARLPRAFAIAGRSGEYLLERHRMSEWDDFIHRIGESEASAVVPGSEGALRITRLARGAFMIGLLGTPHGQPERRPVSKLVQLVPGRYARITLTARHTTYSGQYYSETTYNLSCGSNVAPGRFLAGPPDHDLDLKADLF